MTKWGNADKLQVLNKVGMMDGVIIGKDGFDRSSKQLVNIELKQLDSKIPRVGALVKSEYSFNKASQEMSITGVVKGSVSLSTPFGGGSAEYEVQDQ